MIPQTAWHRRHHQFNPYAGGDVHTERRRPGSVCAPRARARRADSAIVPEMKLVESQSWRTRAAAPAIVNGPARPAETSA
jgi:hypothetical protein